MRFSKALVCLISGVSILTLGCQVNLGGEEDGGAVDQVDHGFTPSFDGSTTPPAPRVDAGGVDRVDSGGLVGPCDSIEEARGLGGPCGGPGECGAGGVCTSNNGEAVCYQRCVPGACTDVCVGDQTCVPLTDASGATIEEDGALVGFCAAPVTGDGCEDVMVCIFECEDSACSQACYANGTPAAAAEANELIACIQANYDLCETDACFEDACSEYWYCMPEPVGFYGEEDCRSTWFCVLECDNDDSDCQEDCLNDVHSDGYSQLMDVFDCAQTAPGETWHSVAEYCSEEWRACDLPEIGDGSCSDFFTCFTECADSRCSLECMLSVNEEAIDQYNAMIDCADQSGILDDPQATFGDIAEGCPDEWAACGLDPIEFGDATCGEVITCMDGCDLTSDAAQQCVGGCQGQGSGDAIAAYNAAVECILGDGCNADAQSASGLFNAEGCPNCAELINACIAP